MANDLNACHFTGRLGADPEIKYLPSGDAVANLRLAVGKQWRDKQSGAKQEATSWINCVAFKKTAELAQQYLAKGAHIRVSCEARESKWKDQNGNNRSAIEFVVREMQFLGGGSQQGGQQPQQNSQQPSQQPPNHQPQGNYGAPQQPAQQPNQHTPQGPGGSFDTFDDEIPFAALHNIYGG